MLWHDTLAGVLRGVVRRVMPPLLAAMLGVLLDAGLLDGELGRVLVELLSS